MITETRLQIKRNSRELTRRACAKRRASANGIRKYYHTKRATLAVEERLIQRKLQIAHSVRAEQQAKKPGYFSRLKTGALRFLGRSGKK